MSSAPGSASGEPPLYGIDSMVFIYHFEDHPELGPAAGRLLRVAEEGRCRLTCSVLAMLEVLVVPKRRGRQDLCRLYREMFRSFPNLSMAPVESEIAEIASDLRAVHNLRTPDAIHLATALRQGATAFVTQDERLRRVSELQILPLSEVPL